MYTDTSRPSATWRPFDPFVVGLGTLLGLALSTSQADAASFNCAKASSWVEKTICADAGLSKLDDQLGHQYQAALRKTTNAAALRQSQRGWLTDERDSCTTQQCLTQVYQTRLRLLGRITKGEAHGTDQTQMAGRYRRWFQDKPDSNSAQIQLQPLGGGVLFVSGDATWVNPASPGSARTGSFAGTVVADGDRIAYPGGQAAGSNADSASCALVISLGKDALDVSNDNGECGGLNVTFDGHYRKARN